jgi:hypothetical protein
MRSGRNRIKPFAAAKSIERHLTRDPIVTEGLAMCDREQPQFTALAYSLGNPYNRAIGLADLNG